MSTLYPVRHGQACFSTDDYDRLSELGRLQARRTGEHFRRIGINLDSVYSGSPKRQRGTAAVVTAEQRRSIDPVVDVRFNEIKNGEQFTRE